MVYNYKNHIDKVYKDGELIAEYDYNLLNQRSKAFYPKENITKYFYYDFMGRMIEEKIGEDIKSFIYLNYKIIGYHYKGELYFNHYSAENTIKAKTNSKGEARYFDYGFDSDVNEANILYYGQYKDEITGLYYNYHRDYSNKLKRYLQIDPLGLYDGTNPYIYANNNNLNYFDFKGLMKCLYIVSISTLECKSESGNNYIFDSGLESGDKNIPLEEISYNERNNRGSGAPIPEGVYELYPVHKGYVEKYDILDFRIGMKKDNPLERIYDMLLNKRYGFQMHIGSISLGCINFNYKDRNLVDNYYDFFIDFEKDFYNDYDNQLEVKDYR